MRASICYGNSALLLLLPASSNIIPQQEKEMSFSKSMVNIPATVLKLDFLQELYEVFFSGFFSTSPLEMSCSAGCPFAILIVFVSHSFHVLTLKLTFCTSHFFKVRHGMIKQ